MLQLRVMLRIESTEDGKTGVDWFVVKQDATYIITVLVILTPVWAAFWVQVANDAFYAKGN